MFVKVGLIGWFAVLIKQWKVMGAFAFADSRFDDVLATTIY